MTDPAQRSDISDLEALEESQDELSTLIAEQEIDDRYGDRINYKRERSLDAPLGHDADASTLAEIVGLPDGQLVALMGDTAAEGVRHITPPSKWTRRMIVTAIRRWHAEHGTPPTYNEWRAARGRGIPPCTTIQRRFGTFAAAVEAAGFAPRLHGGERAPVPNNRGRERMRSQRPDSRLSQRELAAAHALYQRLGLSMNDLAERMWRKYGYSGPATCRAALWRGFHSEGFAVRSKSEAVRLARAGRRKGA